MPKFNITLENGETKEIELSEDQITKSLEGEGKYIHNTKIEDLEARIKADNDKNINQLQEDIKRNKEGFANLLKEKEVLIERAYGVKKKDGESTREYEERAQRESQGSNKEEDSNSLLEQKIAKMEETFNKRMALAEEEKQAILLQQKQESINNTIEKAFNEVRTSYAEDKKVFANRYENDIKRELANFEIEKQYDFNGTIYENVLKKDGVLVFNDNNRPKTLNAYISENTKDLQGANKTQKGSGANKKDISGNAYNNNNKSLDNVSSFETGQELTKALQAKGIRFGSEEYDKIYNNWMEQRV